MGVRRQQLLVLVLVMAGQTFRVIFGGGLFPRLAGRRVWFMALRAIELAVTGALQGISELDRIPGRHARCIFGPLARMTPRANGIDVTRISSQVGFLSLLFLSFIFILEKLGTALLTVTVSS